MNSLPRLVGESLESTDATNLSSKQVLTLIDNDSTREIKGMDLSNPSFTNVNADMINTNEIITRYITGRLEETLEITGPYQSNIEIKDGNSGEGMYITTVPLQISTNKTTDYGGFYLRNNCLEPYSLVNTPSFTAEKARPKLNDYTSTLTFTEHTYSTVYGENPDYFDGDVSGNTYTGTMYFFSQQQKVNNAPITGFKFDRSQFTIYTGINSKYIILATIKTDTVSNRTRKLVVILNFDESSLKRQNDDCWVLGQDIYIMPVYIYNNYVDSLTKYNTFSISGLYFDDRLYTFRDFTCIDSEGVMFNFKYKTWEQLLS